MAVSDDFNRADDTSLGANWTDLLGGMRVISNSAHGETNGVYDVSVWSANSWNANQSSQAVVKTGFVDIALYVRASGSGAAMTGYHAMAHNSVGMRIYRVDAGPSYTLLNDIAGTVSAGDTIKFDASGSTLTYYKNAASQGTASDSTYGTGSAGISSGSDTSVPAWDDWTGTGEVVAGGGTVGKLLLLGVGG